jgi:hypothetical protein
MRTFAAAIRIRLSKTIAAIPASQVQQEHFSGKEIAKEGTY